MIDFNELEQTCYNNAKAKGFWDNPRNFGEAIALCHSEVSEAYQGFVMGNPPDDKLPQYSSVDTELADVVIRLMDMSGGFGLRLPLHIDLLKLEIDYKGVEDSLLKIHLYLSEALEAHRKNKGELCSANLSIVIRIIVISCEELKIDLESVVSDKLGYNKTRPYKHGKGY